MFDNPFGISYIHTCVCMHVRMYVCKLIPIPRSGGIMLALGFGVYCLRFLVLVQGSGTGGS